MNHVANTAVTEAPPGLSLVFGVGELLCALALRDVVETIRPLPVQPLAGSADVLLGVSVIRGLAVPVVDTARLLGAAAERPCRFVTTRTEQGPLAYAIGPVRGVLPVEPDPGRPPPPMLAAAATRLVAAVGVLDSRPLLFLRGAALMTERSTALMTERSTALITERSTALMAESGQAPDAA